MANFFLFFGLGKLTRLELEEELQHILDKKTLRLHNKFLLANLTNALQESPANGGSLKGWTRGSGSNKGFGHQADSEVAKLKSDIMGLSVRERKRIKAIAKVSITYFHTFFERLISNIFTFVRILRNQVIHLLLFPHARRCYRESHYLMIIIQPTAPRPTAQLPPVMPIPKTVATNLLLWQMILKASHPQAVSWF